MAEENRAAWAAWLEQHRTTVRPVGGRPKESRETLILRVRAIARLPFVREFCIGRGTDLSERKSAHSSDDIVELYSADSADNAIEVETALLRTYHNHPKCTNQEPREGGTASDESGNSVYMAIWL